MSDRNKAYYRDMREKHISHKKYIVKNYWNEDYLLSNKVFCGKLSKGKIHCSCFLCSSKTKVIGYSASDKRKQEFMDYSENNLEDD